VIEASELDEARINRLLGGVCGLLVMEYGARPVYEAVQALADNETMWLRLANNLDAIGKASRDATQKMTGHDPGPLPAEGE
jgi:hypothetical protein